MNLVRIQRKNIKAIVETVKQTSSNREPWVKEHTQQEYAESKIPPGKLPKCRVPVALINLLNDELSSLVDRGIK